MADRGPGFWRLSNPIMWAVFATVAFVGLIIWFGLAETCNADLFPKGDCPAKWRHLRAAPFNEVGDTLAGIAGVLAFIWLIATVLLQSIELAEQRKVLALQNAEMEEQRKATQDMAQALAAQAKIFEDEQLARDQKGQRTYCGSSFVAFLISSADVHGGQTVGILALNGPTKEKSTAQSQWISRSAYFLNRMKIARMLILKNLIS